MPCAPQESPDPVERPHQIPQLPAGCPASLPLPASRPHAFRIWWQVDRHRSACGHGVDACRKRTQLLRVALRLRVLHRVQIEEDIRAAACISAVGERSHDPALGVHAGRQGFGIRQLRRSCTLPAHPLRTSPARSGDWKLLHPSPLFFLFARRNMLCVCCRPTSPRTSTFPARCGAPASPTPCSRP